MKNNLIHNSYQVLFVIYAPIAIISLIFTAFSSEYSNFIFISALVTCIVSIILAGVMWVLFLHHRESLHEQKNLPYIIRQRFMLAYIPLMLISFMTLFWFIYKDYYKVVEASELKKYKKITVLYPLTSPIGQKTEDRQYLKEAMGSLLTNRPNLFDKYHLDFIDHKNIWSEELENQIIKKINDGADYFVCAGTTVCNHLGEKYQSLLEKSPISSYVPRIITTYSSAAELPLRRGYFYRFYFRNQEEAQVLAKWAFENKKTKVGFIAADDIYGRNAVDEFKHAWSNLGGGDMQGIYIDPAATKQVVSERILESGIADQNIEALFIAYSDSLNPALAKLTQEKVLLLSANYSSSILSRLTNHIGEYNESRVILSLPRYKINHDSLAQTPAAFLYMTLDRLIEADSKLVQGASFHELWMNPSYPPYLNFEKRSENDFRVEMEARSWKDVQNIAIER